MTKDEKNKMLDEMIQKMKLIPNIGVLYDTISKSMPGIMEHSLKEIFDFDKKLDSDEILTRCHLLLEKFYLHYHINSNNLMKANGHDVMMSGNDMSKLPNDARQEYGHIWKVIHGIRLYGIKTISPDDLQSLNNYYKKYNKGK